MTEEDKQFSTFFKKFNSVKYQKPAIFQNVREAYTPMGKLLAPKGFDVKISPSIEDIQNSQISQQPPRLLLGSRQKQQQISFLIPSNTSKQKLSDIQFSGINQQKKQYSSNRIETNQNFQYIRHLYSSKQIKEAFKLLDTDKDSKIFSQDLYEFMQEIGQPITELQAEDMIKLCDYQGKGYITYDQFEKIAKGQSLAPNEQFLQPTQKMKKNKTMLQQIDKNFQLYRNILTSPQKTKYLAQLLQKHGIC